MWDNPLKANRKWKKRLSPFLYRNQNAIGRKFRRLKDFVRVAMRGAPPIDIRVQANRLKQEYFGL